MVLGRKVLRLDVEVGAVARLQDTRIARKQAGRLLPGDGRDERIAKYERHLHNLLTSTLHELERLQARREGESVPPPAVTFTSVMIESGVVPVGFVLDNATRPRSGAVFSPMSLRRPLLTTTTARCSQLRTGNRWDLGRPVGTDGEP